MPTGVRRSSHAGAYRWVVASGDTKDMSSPHTPASGPFRLLADPRRAVADLQATGRNQALRSVTSTALVTIVPALVRGLQRGARTARRPGAALRYFDAACLLGYLAGMSDTALGLAHLPPSYVPRAIARAAQRLVTAIDGTQWETLLTALDQAHRGHDEPLLALFTRLIRPRTGSELRRRPTRHTKRRHQ